jgi:hypothetical protein
MSGPADPFHDFSLYDQPYPSCPPACFTPTVDAAFLLAARLPGEKRSLTCMNMEFCLNRVHFY